MWHITMGKKFAMRFAKSCYQMMVGFTTVSKAIHSMYMILRSCLACKAKSAADFTQRRSCCL